MPGLFVHFYPLLPNLVGEIVSQHMPLIILQALASLLLLVPGTKEAIQPPNNPVQIPRNLTLPSLKVEDLLSLKRLFQPPTATPIDTLTSKQVTALRRAIIGQESGGNFQAINPDSGALGYGQVMEFNVAPWTKAALGRSLTTKEFLRNPYAQIKTIDYKLNEYLQYELAYTGNQNEEVAIRRVASTWYSGNPNLWNNTRPQYYNGRPYPSIATYTASVWQRYLIAVAR